MQGEDGLGSAERRASSENHRTRPRPGSVHLLPRSSTISRDLAGSRGSTGFYGRRKGRAGMINTWVPQVLEARRAKLVRRKSGSYHLSCKPQYLWTRGAAPRSQSQCRGVCARPGQVLGNGHRQRPCGEGLTEESVTPERGTEQWSKMFKRGLQTS